MSNIEFWRNEWEEVTNVDEVLRINSNTNKPKKTGSVLILYGLGAELGNFNLFAESLKRKLANTYEESEIQIHKTANRNEFINELVNTTLFDITELHIFSHSFGGGLALGYHDQNLNSDRAKMIANNPNYSYDDVVNHEIGCLLTDHLDFFLLSEKKAIQSNLSNATTIKIWGCNSGISNWTYSGEYWKKLNDKNTPKPSIAKSLASYTGKSVYGAESGSHVEYKIKGTWVSGFDYTKIFGKKIPSFKEYTEIRLHPDKGSYKEFTP